MLVCRFPPDFIRLRSPPLPTHLPFNKMLNYILDSQTWGKLSFYGQICKDSTGLAEGVYSWMTTSWFIFWYASTQNMYSSVSNQIREISFSFYLYEFSCGVSNQRCRWILYHRRCTSIFWRRCGISGVDSGVVVNQTPWNKSYRCISLCPSRNLIWEREKKYI